MATTPEGAVKKEITATLRGYYPHVYFFMPVQGGYGAATLDYLGCHRGRAFAIEAKAPGKFPTERQILTMKTMEAAGVRVFIIDSVKECLRLRAWLNGLID